MKKNILSSAQELAALVANPLFRKLMDTLSIGMSIVDLDGTILYMSRATHEIYGLSGKTDVTGKKIEEIFSTAKDGVLKVLQTRTVNKGRSTSYNGDRALCVRYPVNDAKGDLLCCLTEVITGTAEKSRIDELLHDIQTLRQQVDFYTAQGLSPRHLCTFDTLVGESRGMRDLKELGSRFAKTADPILVLGESGTGKELVAQALHQASLRAGKVFLSVNCAALPPELAESELFGYAEGAFTGSRRGGQKGKFELADKGTIFLDEIGDLPLAMQAKLLRVLENGEIQKIGSSRSVYSDFRLIAATNRHLPQLIVKGQFRADLYHRLSALELTIPPLRRRKEDFPLLIAHLLGEISGSARARDIRVSPAVLKLFQHYPWKGNIRELKNVLTYARCCMDEASAELNVSHLPPRFLQDSVLLYEDTPPAPPLATLDASSADAERRAIAAALRRAEGNKSRAAKELGISRSKLYQKLARLGLDSQKGAN